MSPTVDMSKVEINISEQGSGDQCTDGKWASISYKGFLTNGNQVMGSEEVDGKDLIFSVGAAQTFKCFDLALTQLKPGAKARISCPSELVNGGAKLQAPLGGDWIPANSDMDFDVEVKFCNHTPGGGLGEYWQDQFWSGPPVLKPGNCVTIHGAQQRRLYWIRPVAPLKDTTFYCWKAWGGYCGVWTGEIWQTYKDAGAEIFKTEYGLDGTAGSISFLPQITKESGAHLKISKWGGFTFGVGSNDHFKRDATFVPTLTGLADGSFTMLSPNNDFSYLTGKTIALWGSLFFTDNDYYKNTIDGNRYNMIAKQVECPKA